PPADGLRHERRAHYRRGPALPGRAGRRFARRADRPGLAGSGRPPTAPVVRHATAPELPAFDATAVELAGRRTARRRGGTAAQGPARSSPPDRAAVLRAGQPAHALGAQLP